MSRFTPHMPLEPGLGQVEARSQVSHILKSKGTARYCAAISLILGREDLASPSPVNSTSLLK